MDKLMKEQLERWHFTLNEYGSLRLAGLWEVENEEIDKINAAFTHLLPLSRTAETVYIPGKNGTIRLGKRFANFPVDEYWDAGVFWDFVKYGPALSRFTRRPIQQAFLAATIALEGLTPVTDHLITRPIPLESWGKALSVASPHPHAFKAEIPCITIDTARPYNVLVINGDQAINLDVGEWVEYEKPTHLTMQQFKPQLTSIYDELYTETIALKAKWEKVVDAVNQAVGPWALIGKQSKQ